jgi:iron complex transport system substrate-binding protein
VAEGARDAPTFPATKNIPAVKNRCFLVPSYDEVTPGPRNAEAVVAIAGVPHPATFGLPPGGRDPEVSRSSGRT